MIDIISKIRYIRPGRLRQFIYNKYFEYCETTWRDRPLPGFLIIGAQKSGTTSLFHCLRQHPQLISSPLKKEIHFFSTLKWRKNANFEKGESWYRAHFPRQQDLGVGSITFESTPDYLFHPLVPERIFNLMPQTKLIAILRNPTERAISQYFMELRKNREPLSMLEAFQQEEARLEKAISEQDYQDRFFIQLSYKSRGRYAEQIERYLQFFPTQQILFLSSEEFFLDPQESLRCAFDFIGVESSFKVPNLAPRNVSKNKSDIPLEVYAYLNEYFRPYNQVLCQLTGKNFGW
jgi:hypothetical protein